MSQNIIPKMALYSRQKDEFIRYYDKNVPMSLINEHLAKHFIQYPIDMVEVCVTPNDSILFIGLRIKKVVCGLQFKIKQFMRTNPGQDEIDKFYTNHILPYDKRSIKEILKYNYELRRH